MSAWSPDLWHEQRPQGGDTNQTSDPGGNRGERSADPVGTGWV